MFRLRYAALKNKPRTLLCLTGLTVAEFESLVPSFNTAWQDYLHQQLVQDKPRQRRFGGGRKATLHSVEDKLLFILLYFQLYPLQVVSFASCILCKKGKVSCSACVKPRPTSGFIA